MQRACWWLQVLRTDTLAYAEAIFGINLHLREGGIALADIGATEEEILERKTRGLQLMAMYWLQRLRRGSIMYAVYLDSVHKCLDEAVLYPEDIGSSDQELKFFGQKVDEATFKKWRRAVPPAPFNYGVRF